MSKEARKHPKKVTQMQKEWNEWLAKDAKSPHKYIEGSDDAAIGMRMEESAQFVVSFYFLFFNTSMATTMPMITSMRRNMKKQIQRFLRADCADTTAFSV